MKETVTDVLYDLDRERWSKAEQGSCSGCFQAGATYAVRLLIEQWDKPGLSDFVALFERLRATED